MGGGTVRAKDGKAVREELAKLEVDYEVEAPVPVDPERRERLDAVRRWHEKDWKVLDQKLRSSIIEGLSVFLSVFDLPDVAATFCPPKPPLAERRPGLGTSLDGPLLVEPGWAVAQLTLPPKNSYYSSCAGRRSRGLGRSVPSRTGWSR